MKRRLGVVVIALALAGCGTGAHSVMEAQKERPINYRMSQQGFTLIHQRDDGRWFTLTRQEAEELNQVCAAEAGRAADTAYWLSSWTHQGVREKYLMAWAACGSAHKVAYWHAPTRRLVTPEAMVDHWLHAPDSTEFRGIPAQVLSPDPK